MKKTLYVLMVSQLAAQSLSAHPLLTYSDQFGMHLSPNKGIKNIHSDEDVYLHLYFGLKPNQAFIDEVDKFSKENNIQLEMSVLNPQVSFQQNKYRVILGPIDQQALELVQNTLKDKGIDSFPMVYVKNDDITVRIPNASTDSNEWVHIDLSEDGSPEQSAEMNPYQTAVIEMANHLSSQNISSQNLNDGLVDSAKSFIKNKAQSIVSEYGEAWLSQYGTAKIDFELDEKFNFSSGSLDLLVPFYRQVEQQNQSIWFIQPGVVLNDENAYQGRDFAHIGLGYRYKTPEYFYGLNLFYDRDLTDKHQRMSIGVEYARPFVKLNSNYYFALSDWRDTQMRFQSMGDAALQARAASGLDLNIVGRLPQYPWLSLETEYQQYFGDHVELKGGQDPVKNPYVIQSTLIYQPVPLMSLSAGYQYEAGGEKGAVLGAHLTYQIGVPLNKQLSSAEVAASNTLDAQLFDLVDREHNIRLEYREKLDDVDLAVTQSDFSLVEGHRMLISDWIKLTGDVSRVRDIDFSGTGAPLVTPDKKYIVAPAFNISEPSLGHTRQMNLNMYEIKATIYLADGSQLIVPQPAIIRVEIDNQVNGIHDVVLSRQSDKITGSNVGTGDQIGYLVTGEVQNLAGRPIANKTVELITSTQGASFRKTSVKTNAAGQFQSVLNSTLEGEVVFTIVEGTNRYEGIAEFDKGKEANVEKSLFSTSKKTIVANSHQSLMIELKLNDRLGAAVANREVVFKAYQGDTLAAGVNITRVIDNQGVYTANLTATAPGLIVIKASIVGQSDFEKISENIVLTPQVADQNKSTIEISSKTIEANNSEEAVVTLTLKDVDNQIVTDRKVQFTVTKANQATSDIILTPITETNGVYRVRLVAKQAGDYQIKATIENQNDFQKTIDIRATEALKLPSVAHSSISIPENIPGNGFDTGTITIELKDAAGVGLSGHQLVLKAYNVTTPDIVSDEVTFGNVVEQTNGRYTATIKGYGSDKNLRVTLVRFPEFILNSASPLKFLPPVESIALSRRPPGNCSGSSHTPLNVNLSDYTLPSRRTCNGTQFEEGLILIPYPNSKIDIKFTGVLERDPNINFGFRLGCIKPGSGKIFMTSGLEKGRQINVTCQ